MRTASPVDAGPVVALVLIGAALNGFWVRLVESWQASGLGSPLVSVSPFELAAAAVGAWCILRSSSRALPLYPLPELALGAALLLPSSAAAWVALAAYALFRSWFAAGEQRTGFLFFLALALCAIWSSVGIKLAAGWVYSPDVHAVAAILSWFRDDIAINGNVVGVPTGHNVIVLTVCTTAYALPRAILGYAAVLHLAGGANRRRWLGAGLAAAVLAIAFNLLRLSLMTWSLDYYQFLHGPVGANIIDGAQTIGIIVLALWAAK